MITAGAGKETIAAWNGCEFVSKIVMSKTKIFNYKLYADKNVDYVFLGYA